MIFNRKNTEHVVGSDLLILGQAPALYDSINVSHPELFNLYKKQKSMDWQETECSLIQTRIDLDTCPIGIRDVMLYNLAYQWEIDSMASRSFAILLAPFITNAQFWSSLLKNTEIEVLHALTYSEIIRQCIKDPKDVFDLVLKTKQIEDRSSAIIIVMEDLKKAGAEFTLGIVPNDQKLFNRVYLGIVAMYLLERISFMSSFASTFIMAEQGYFKGACDLVQKIAIDELDYHAAALKYVIEHLSTKDSRGVIAAQECKEQIKELFNSAIKQEYSWNKFLFSEKRQVVGLNEQLANQWADFNGWFAKQTLGIEQKSTPPQNPLKYMEHWLNLDLTQNAQQESSGNNYSIVALKDDLLDEVFDY